VVVDGNKNTTTKFILAVLGIEASQFSSQ